MNKNTISIAEDFSAYPAGRYPADGEYNATTFRKEVLIPAPVDLIDSATGGDFQQTD